MSESKQMALSEAAHAVGGTLHGIDTRFASVSTDSRTLPAGALFVALKGPKFDGHGYVEQARAQGAAALLVDHRVDCDLPQVVVADTRLALGRLANAWRRTLDVRLIAVTGSNGKTTVKEMIAAILGRIGPTLATQGNLNNDIGVPITLLRLQPEHRFAVIEMGTNHPGEIEYLTHLAEPDVALVNNASTAHLEGFGSVNGVAREKGTIYNGLGHGGIAIVNRDDPHAEDWMAQNSERVLVTFGLSARAQVWAEWSAGVEGSAMTLHTPDGSVPVNLRLLGRHNVANAMAAASAAGAAGASLEQIRTGLEAMEPVSGRLQVSTGAKGARIINDTYNANPASLTAAIAVLQTTPGRRFLALGDMGELGEDAETFHRQVGVQARAAGVERLYATGELSRLAVETFGSEGRHFDTKPMMVDALRADLDKDVTLLVKGSRSMRMEQVVEALIEQEA